MRQLEIQLPAEPEPLQLELDRTAVLVVDMQNAFASPGGMLDLAGVDVPREMRCSTRVWSAKQRGQWVFQ